MAKVVFMERSDGAFQKVVRTAETESDSFGASGSGPMHEKLRALYDFALRAYPGLEADEAFAMAWRDLSLSDRAQIRDEESGELAAAGRGSCAVPRIIYARRRARRKGKQNERRTSWDSLEGRPRRACRR